jgi:hypothetical protein
MPRVPFFASLRRAVTRRGVRAQAERDTVGDTLPLCAAALVAWWTTVRPAAFVAAPTFRNGWLDAWAPRVTGTIALFGVALSGWAVARRAPGFVAIVLASFVAPCAVTWVLGAESATALSEPIEVLLGAIAWTAVGVVLMRPQAVAVPRGAEGGRGPTIGAGDDVARVAMKEVEAEFLVEPPPKLVPRQPQPLLASVPVVVSAVLAGAVGYQAMRVAANVPERAILARIVGAACAIALLSAGGELVEVRYLPRRESTPRKRLQRALIPIAVFVVLLFIGAVLAGREGPGW